MRKHKLGLGEYTRTEIGSIKEAEDKTQLENTVELSEKNFRSLISMLPKTDTHNALNNELLSIKDMCTTLSMKEDLTRKDISDMLIKASEYEIFMQDITDFRKQPDIKIVGKINLKDI